MGSQGGNHASTVRGDEDLGRRPATSRFADDLGLGCIGGKPVVFPRASRAALGHHRAADAGMANVELGSNPGP